MSERSSGPVFVAGHRGMVGGAILRSLRHAGQREVLCCTRAELDLTDQRAVRDWFHTYRPAQVYLAAAHVGGIHANDTYPAEFIFDNLLIAANVIDAAWRAGVGRLLFLGSSCIYPRAADQPMAEEALLTGPLEPTNEPYAIAKIAGIKLCESYNRQYGTDFRSLMPTNLYGPGDNFDLANSHVIPALIRKMSAAMQAGDASVTIWGTGQPRREFLHVQDLAEASLHVMALPREQWRRATNPRLSHLNVGSGQDITIAALADLIARIIGFRGELRFDATKPDGAPRKLLDVTRLRNLGWQARIDLEDGLRQTWQWFLAHQGQLRG